MSKRGQRAPRKEPSRLRIVGGEWGGRFVSFQDAEGLRPTGERVRETLFNWLQYDIAGAQVLDLFAGSGALSFEARSRGAAHIDVVEQHAPTISQLKRQFGDLAMDRIDFHQCSALTFLENSALGYDVIFIDPPFHSTLMQETLAILAERLPIEATLTLYLEFDRRHPPELPEGWEYRRLKEAGEVGYGLVEIAPNP